MQLNCIIVEDEPLAVDILKTYINQVPFLKLIAACHTALDAYEILGNSKIDLMFLDIHLPKLKGLEFLATLKNPPKVIVTTAYHEYALNGYEHNVLDYLLKPIEFNRFLTAIKKLDLASVNARPLLNSNNDVEQDEHIFFNVNKKKVKVYLKEISFIESQKEYIKIVTTQKEVITKLSITEIEGMLSKANFLRVHRSFIVSKKKIEAFTSTDIEVAGKQIPIGRTYKDLVQTVLDQLF